MDSANSDDNSAQVERLAVEVIGERPQRTAPRLVQTPAQPAPQPSPTPAIPSRSTRLRDSAIFGTLQAIGIVLSVRVILLLAVMGGLGLALIAMQKQTDATLYVLIAYAILILAPIVALDWRRGPAT